MSDDALQTEALDPFRYIDVERTIAEFGYDPRELSKGSGKKVYIICSHCGKVRIKTFQKSNQSKCRYCVTIREVSNLDNIKHVDVKKTIEELGYDPRLLKPRSHKKVFVICIDCGVSWLKVFNFATKEIRCMSCSRSGENHPLFGRTGENAFFFGKTHSQETRDKMSIAQSGEKNPMYGKKHSKERKAKMSAAFSGEKNPRFGKPPAKTHGDYYTKRDGSKVYLRASWEPKFAKYLDNNNQHWEYECKGFLVTYEFEGKIKSSTYWPDFFVNNEWFEVKGTWTRYKESKYKFEAFKAQYPDEKITLLMKPELLALGIDVK